MYWSCNLKGIFVRKNLTDFPSRCNLKGMSVHDLQPVWWGEGGKIWQCQAEQAGFIGQGVSNFSNHNIPTL